MALFRLHFSLVSLWPPAFLVAPSFPRSSGNPEVPLDFSPPTLSQTSGPWSAPDALELVGVLPKGKMETKGLGLKNYKVTGFLFDGSDYAIPPSTTPGPA